MIARTVATKTADKAADITMKLSDLRVEHAKQNAIDQIDGEKKYNAEFSAALRGQNVALLESYGTRSNYVKTKIAEDKANRHRAQQEEYASYQKQLDDLTNLTKKYVDKAGTITPFKAVAGQTSRGIEDMDFLGADAKEQMEDAKKLFDFWKTNKISITFLLEDYMTNPFFKKLVDGELKRKTLELREDIDNLGNSPTWTDPEMVQYIDNLENIANLVSGVMTSAFDAALISGQNFFKVMWKGLVAMLNKLLAALGAALLLGAVLSAFGGPSSVVGFVPIFKKLSGFNLEGINPQVKPVEKVAGVSGTGQGNVSFEIQGDKLYGVLQNYNGRLSRLV